MTAGIFYDKYFWPGANPTSERLYPRWHPHFTCKSYQPSIELNLTTLHLEELKERAGGTHKNIYRSNLFDGVIIKPQQRHSCELMFLEYLSGYRENPFGLEPEQNTVQLPLFPNPFTDMLKSLPTQHRADIKSLYEEFVPHYHGWLPRKFCAPDPRPYKEMLSFLHPSAFATYCSVVEDITVGFNRLSILDITIQSRHFGPAEPVLKGLRSWLPRMPSDYQAGQDSGKPCHWYFHLDFSLMRKSWRTMSHDNVLACMIAAFFDGKTILHDVVKEFIPKVQRVVDLLSSQREFILADSSLLFLYESDSSASEPDKVSLKLIDFDEATPYWGIRSKQSERFAEQDTTLEELLYLLRGVQNTKSKHVSLESLIEKCPTLQIATSCVE